METMTTEPYTDDHDTADVDLLALIERLHERPTERRASTTRRRRTVRRRSIYELPGMAVIA
jgi:hypothetical protein